MHTKKIIHYIFIASILCGGTVLAGWNTPTIAPGTPGSSIIPLHNILNITNNTLSSPQTKIGSLSVNKFVAFGGAEFDQSTFFNAPIDSTGGTVYFGSTATPANLVALNGGVQIKGTGLHGSITNETLQHTGADKEVCADAAGKLKNCTTTAAPIVQQPAITFFSATPTSITKGSSALLTWASTNTTSCTGTGFTPSTTSSSTGISVAPTTTTTYTITCSGAASTTPATANTLVTVIPIPKITSFSVVSAAARHINCTANLDIAARTGGENIDLKVKLKDPANMGGSYSFKYCHLTIPAGQTTISNASLSDGGSYLQSSGHCVSSSSTDIQTGLGC
jgi:hypothetical protein